MQENSWPIFISLLRRVTVRIYDFQITREVFPRQMEQETSGETKQHMLLSLARLIMPLPLARVSSYIVVLEMQGRENALFYYTKR